MAKLKLVTTPWCTCRLPQEAEIGWERAAYLALEMMEDARLPRRVPSGAVRSRC
jgi:hypothetical protein